MKGHLTEFYLLTHYGVASSNPFCFGPGDSCQDFPLCLNCHKCFDQAWIHFWDLLEREWAEQFKRISCYDPFDPDHEPDLGQDEEPFWDDWDIVEPWEWLI